MARTIIIRMDLANYDFLTEITKQERSRLAPAGAGPKL